MVDTGAKQGIVSLNDVMTEIKDMLGKSMQGVKSKMLDQGKKMASEYEANGELVVKKMQEQHDDAMHQFSDLLGNERAGDHN